MYSKRLLEARFLTRYLYHTHDMILCIACFACLLLTLPLTISGGVGGVGGVGGRGGDDSVVYCVLVFTYLLLLAEDAHWRRRLLQTLQQIHDLRLLLHVLHFLDHIQVGRSRTPDVNQHLRS